MKNKWKNKKIGIKKIPIKCIILLIAITGSIVITRDTIQKFYAETTLTIVSATNYEKIKSDYIALKNARPTIKQVKGGTITEITMYTSRPEETDNSPCIGASGQNQCVLWRNGQNICATNKYPRGTVLKIDKLGECLVIDSMNSRYKNRIDWYAGYDDDCLDGFRIGDYCPNLKRAIDFGLQKLLVKVMK